MAKYTPLKFFKNWKEKGFKEALRIDSQRTAKDLGTILIENNLDGEPTERVPHGCTTFLCDMLIGGVAAQIWPQNLRAEMFHRTVLC